MLKRYRAFAKKNREWFIWIDHNIHRIETIQEILKQWNVRKDAYFKYYGKKYSVVLSRKGAQSSLSSSSFSC